MSAKGALIGAAVGGAYGLATGKDPVKSAMTGAAVGAGGGALMGVGGLGAAGAGTAGAGTTSALMGSGGGFAGGGYGSIGAGSAFNAAAPFANATMPTYAATGTSTGLIPSSTATSPSLLSSFTGGLQSLNTFANQNPVTTNIGLQTAGSLLTPPEPLPMAPPPGLMRGQQFQMEQPMYAMSQQQPISLI